MRAIRLTLGVGVAMAASLACGALARAERLPARIFTVADGLPTDHVTNIRQDSRGYLWLCTASGLCRYDGSRFVEYTTANGLSHPSVTDLLQTTRDTYWVATLSGVCRFHVDRTDGGALFERVPFGEPSEQYRVHELIEDHSGRIWVATQLGLFRIVELGPSVRVESVPLPDTEMTFKNVRHLDRGPDDSIWVCWNNGLTRYRPDGSTQHYPILAEHPGSTHDVYGLHVDQRGHVWLSTPEGAYIVAPDDSIGSDDRMTPLAQRALPARSPGHGQTLQRPERAGEVRLLSSKDDLPDAPLWSDIATVSTGDTWVGTRRGPVRISMSGIHLMSLPDGGSPITVTRIVEDRDHNIWLATDARGVIRLAPTGATAWTDAEGLCHGPAFALMVDGSGTLLTVHGGDKSLRVGRFEGERFSCLSLNVPGEFGEVGWGWNQMAALADDDTLWVPLGAAIARYRLDFASGRLPIDPDLTFNRLRDHGINQVFRLFLARDRSLWCGTFGEASVVRWALETDELAVFDDSTPGLPNAAATAFIQDAHDAVWIGFYNGSVARWRDGGFELFSVEHGVPPGFVNDLVIDIDGSMLIATTMGGVGRCVDPTAQRPVFERYLDASTGLSSDWVEAMAVDQEGRLCLGTPRGIDILDRASGTVRHLTSGDGLAESRARIVRVDSAGRVWLAGRHGLSSLDPPAPAATRPPSVYISGLSIDGEARPLHQLGALTLGPLTLRSFEDRVRIECTAVSHAPGGALAFQHRLVGLDESWSKPTPDSIVSYASLPPDEYRFEARAVLGGGIVSAVPASLEFSILAPFWQRWWFIAGVSAGIGAIGYAIHRLRIARLLAMQRVRERIAADLHDDLGSSLSHISVLSELARRESANGSTRATELLSQIGDKARQLIGDTDDMIWSINPRRDDLQSLAGRIRHLLGEMADGRAIAWRVEAPPESVNPRIGTDQRRQLFLIIKEAVHNVIKHAGASSLTVRLALAGRSLRIEVIDDGRGFEQAADGTPTPAGDDHDGLANMAARARRLRGVLAVRSSAAPPDHGTTISITITLTVSPV
jgi:ligand-binding sensor domain-containing protein/signal transduction histidine kinase